MNVTKTLVLWWRTSEKNKNKLLGIGHVSTNKSILSIGKLNKLDIHINNKKKKKMSWEYVR